MANYKSKFTGKQVDDAIGLISGKGLDNVINGIVFRDANGLFKKADESILNFWYDTTNKIIKKTLNGITSNIISMDNIYRDTNTVSKITYNAGTLTQTKHNSASSEAGTTTIFTLTNLETDLKKGKANGIAPLNASGQLDSSYATWAAQKATTVTNVSYGNKKFVKTINGTTTDIVSIDTIATDLGKGVANGIVPLNSSTKIDATYLPSYVDDVLEYSGISKFPTAGETGKIYVDTTTNLTYRWSGSTYVEISPGTVVTITPSLTTGTKSATISINGTAYNIYSTTPPTKVSQLTNDSNFINQINISSSGSGNVVTGLSASGGTITYTLGNAGVSGDYLSLTGGTVTGPTTFGDSVSIDDLNAGQLIVSGSASFANNLQANTINGVAVGNSPKFTDTTYSVASTTANGLMSVADKTKLDGIEEGAEANRGLFIQDEVVNEDALELRFDGFMVAHAEHGTPGAITRRITISLPAASANFDGSMSKEDKAKLDGIATGAEVNQNAFSEILVNDSIISADAKTDHFQVIGSNGIEVSSVADSLLISGKYATTSESGVMSAADKKKLNGIDDNATENVIGPKKLSLGSSVAVGSHATAILPFKNSTLFSRCAVRDIALRDSNGNTIRELAITGFFYDSSNSLIKVIVYNTSSSSISVNASNSSVNVITFE